MRPPWTSALLWVVAGCAGHRAEPAVQAPLPPATAPAVVPADQPAFEDERTVTWATLREQIDALVCVRTFERPDGTTDEMPWSGDREICGLPAPQTAVERAVAAAFEAAKPATISLSADRKAAQEIIRSRTDDGRVAAMREAMLSEAFMGMLLPRLLDAVAAEGLECRDCPTPVPLELREVEWATLEPYLVAHVWPDPVVTPRDERGRPTGQPRLSVHVCVGINGIAQMEAPDPALVRAAYLGVIHADAVQEAVISTVSSVSTERAYEKLRTDEARTEHLRAQVGSRVMAQPDVRRAVCETLRRFEPDTGVVVGDCAVSTLDAG